MISYLNKIHQEVRHSVGWIPGFLLCESKTIFLCCVPRVSAVYSIHANALTSRIHASCMCIKELMDSSVHEMCSLLIELLFIHIHTYTFCSTQKSNYMIATTIDIIISLSISKLHLKQCYNSQYSHSYEGGKKVLISCTPCKGFIS